MLKWFGDLVYFAYYGNRSKFSILCDFMQVKKFRVRFLINNADMQVATFLHTFSLSTNRLQSTRDAIKRCGYIL